MAVTKIKVVLIKELQKLLDEDLDQFIWHLLNPMTEDITPILPAKLQKANRRDVVDCMASQYSTNAGNIAVQVLRCMEKNDLASELEGKLQEVLPSETVDGRNASASVEDQPIQSDWTRPKSITQSSQEFRSATLRNNRNNVYIPKDKSQRRRLALLITNIRFKDSSGNRKGAERDHDNMEWLLTALGYSVEKYTDLTGDEIKDKVRIFARRSEHRDSDSTFVVLMSHGNIINNKDAIIGVDYPKNPKDFFFVDDIFSHLNSKNCPALIDKPKVILIQACRGDHPGGVEIQSDAFVHLEKDFFCFKSCLPGISAYRHPVEGSYFICYIVDVFCKQAHIDDIMELFRMIALRMEKDPRFTGLEKLMPCIDRTSVGKKLYLFPGL
ncbi:caspase b-like [Pimephales promelas]|uniref:caspase b-like n=1 Tax=Pimephales promelas TaxID=90988 RepID=UPI001955B796|nr:caspase b-like [Pimephales promelas]